MATLQAGGLLARRYRLIDRIGAGGMSIIWRARDEVLDRIVAIKVLAPTLAADARFRALVREEARAAAQLVHPHVTSVHDYGETVAPDGTVTGFVVMELLAGEGLDARLTAGPLPWTEAVLICAQVAQALAAAHRLGIVHRDVTPGNIVLTATGVKVLDFGIATHIGAPDEDEDGNTFGTPAYVAPERLDGTPAQPATDIYSMGVLLYETLTGRVPFPAQTWDDLVRSPRNETVPPLTGVTGLPRTVADICLHCLAVDPADRPTAHQVAVALRDQLAQSAADLAPTLSAHKATGPSGRDRQRITLLAGGSVAALTVILLAATALRGPAPAPQVLPGTTAPDRATAGPTLGSSPDPPGEPVPPAPVTPSGPAPSPAAPTVGEAVTALDQLITTGVTTGAIRDDAGLDLRNYLRNIERAAATGAIDLTEPVAELRQKVAVRVTEGAITTGYARQLDEALVRLGRAAS